MRAAVIVLSWNGAAYLGACLEALHHQREVQADLLVVDNGSRDGSVDLVRARFPAVALIENGRNLGFSAGMNVGMRWLRARPEPPDVIVLLNQDTVVAPDWLGWLLEPLGRDPQVGAVGCKIYYPDGQTLQHAGGLIEPGRAAARHFGYREIDGGQYDHPRDLDYVTGAAVALRSSALDQVGLFDEGYSPAYYEEIDLCWRLRQAGYTVRYEPRATLRHAESASIADVVPRSVIMQRNRLRFVVKTFPTERIRDDFLLAERARMAVIAHSTEARTLRRAYLEGMFRGAEWLAARERCYPISAAEAAWLGQLCAGLRRDMAAFDRMRAAEQGAIRDDEVGER